jgi:hypothetical protein
VTEADARKVLWAYGIVKKGALTSIDSALRTALKLASNGHPGQHESSYSSQPSFIRLADAQRSPAAGAFEKQSGSAIAT